MALAGLLTLGGPLFAQEEPPAQAEGVVAQEEPPANVEGVVAGKDLAAPPTDSAQEQAAGDEAPKGAKARVGKGGSGRRAQVSPAAKAFAEKLLAALTLELEIQEYERSTLGLKDPETLNGYPLARWHRIEADRDFAEIASQISLTPLDLPAPAATRNLSLKTRSALFDLKKAYETSRRNHSLDQMMNLGRAFLKTGDWGLRDRAVRARDSMIEREAGYTRLGKIATDIVSGEMGEVQGVGEIELALKDLAPELQEELPEMEVLVLEDDGARKAAQSAVATLIGTRTEAEPPPRPLPALREEVTLLYDAMIGQADLSATITEYGDLTDRLELVDDEFEKIHERIDEITQTPRYDSRDIDRLRDRAREIVDLKVELSRRRNQLSTNWYSTPVDEKTFTQLISANEELARRMMIDLGAPGVLFGTQLDLLIAERERGFASDWSRWTLIEGYQDLLANLFDAWPERDPLEGLKPPSLLGQKLLKQALAQAAAAKGGKSGPPKAPAKKPQKKKKKKGGKKKPR